MNLAEGLGRSSFQETVEFCRESLGSATEIREHLATDIDEEYSSEKEFQELDRVAQSA